MTRVITETRFERIVKARREAATRWVGWRIFAVDVMPDEDGLSRINVFIDPATGATASGITNLSFLIDAEGRRSRRLEALLVACGVTHDVDDLSMVEGRHFAARDNGRTTSDFGLLSLALQAAA